MTITATPGRSPRWRLRPLAPGDLGWVISRHGSIYAEEFGWDATFEYEVAGIAADIMKRFDPGRENAWIAERDSVRLGAVFLVQANAETAKLRRLIVDPAARGLGIGARLVAECTIFARNAGYRRITLWTHSVLVAARRLYTAAGYRLIPTIGMFDRSRKEASASFLKKRSKKLFIRLASRDAGQEGA